MSNGITWEFEEDTLYSSEQADELTRRIRDTGEVKESEDSLVYSFCFILTHTRKVSFDALKVRSLHLKALPDFLSTWQGLTPSELWAYRRKNISHDLFSLWANDYTNNRGLLMADPEELLETALTPEQRVEASMPKSPLP
jgi:hypothetical protein